MTVAGLEPGCYSIPSRRQYLLTKMTTAVILGQFPQMWVGGVGRRSILRKQWWFQDYRSYDGNKLSLIRHYLNKDERCNFLEN